MAGSVACVCGCVMWAMELNFKHPHELEVWQVVVGDGMALGMFGEALGLLAACMGMSPLVDDRSFNRWAQISVLLELLCCIYLVVGHMTGLSISYLLLPCASIGAALGALVCLAGAHSWGLVAASSEARVGWRWVFVGSVLTLVGAAVLGAWDSDCAGPYCFTESFPWESSPCRWNTASPQGSSCPLPEVFNHAAVMHTFAIVGVTLMSHGLQGLLACGWEPHALSDRKRKY